VGIARKTLVHKLSSIKPVKKNIIAIKVSNDPRKEYPLRASLFFTTSLICSNVPIRHIRLPIPIMMPINKCSPLSFIPEVGHWLDDYLQVRIEVLSKSYGILMRLKVFYESILNVESIDEP